MNQRQLHLRFCGSQGFSDEVNFNLDTQGASQFPAALSEINYPSKVNISFSSSPGYYRFKLRISSGELNAYVLVDNEVIGFINGYNDIYYKDGKVYYVDGSTHRDMGITVNADTWYRMKYVLNLDAKKYDMYFNGSSTPMVSQANFRDTLSSVSKIQFQVNESPGYDVNMNIDDVKINTK